MLRRIGRRIDFNQEKGNVLIVEGTILSKKKRKKKQIRTEESIKTMEREYIENRKKERKKVKTQRLDKFN